MMIKIALCDDEPKTLDTVSMYIKKYAQTKSDDVFETVCFSSANALLSALEDHKTFDVFILDVYIGDLMGTELAKNIRKNGIESPIIFLTTSIEHAPQSFETGTLRYLIKPLDPQKLYEAMDVAVAQLKKMQKHLLKFKTENGIESVNVTNVMCSEAHNHHQYITLNKGKQIKIRSTVTELYSVISSYGGFIRVGSAYIVNLRNIKNVTNHEVNLYNDIRIPIPRGKHSEIKKAFWDYQYQGQED